MLEKLNISQSSDRYLSVRQAVQAYPWLSEGTVRWWIFIGNQNNFESCILRIGRKILIDREKFEYWLTTNPPAIQKPKPKRTSKSGRA
jgi:hypothetical protein